MRAGFPHRGTQPCNIYSMPGKVVTLTGNSPQNHGHQPISTIPGHYVPNLALAIVKGNAQTNDFRIPLAGFLVGNPWTDAAIDNLGAVDFW